MSYLLLSFFSFFLFLFFFYVLIVKVQELECSASYAVKKTLIPNNPPLHLFMGKIKHPEFIGKIPLAKLLRQYYLRHVRKQFIETYRRETQTLPKAPLKTKERIGSRRPDRARGGGCGIAVMRENH